jgi:hypothetical protein
MRRLPIKAALGQVPLGLVVSPFKHPVRRALLAIQDRHYARVFFTNQLSTAILQA